MFLPNPLIKLSIVRSLRDWEVACSASDLQGLNFESCVWSSLTSPSFWPNLSCTYIGHKTGLKPISFLPWVQLPNIGTNVIMGGFPFLVFLISFRDGALLNPFKPEFTIVIFIHYKAWIAFAILHLWWMKMIWCGFKIKENHHVLVNQFHENFLSKTLDCRKMKSVFWDVKWCFIASWRLKGLILLILRNTRICYTRFISSKPWQN